MRFKRIEVTDQNEHKTEFLKDIDTGKLYKRTGLVPRDFPGCQIVEEEVEQVPCEDAISRQAVLTEIDKYLCGVLYERGIDKVIKDLPPVTPKTKTGRWINAKVGRLFPSNDFKCSECGNILNFDGVNGGRGDANFCPNCGAKMEREG